MLTLSEKFLDTCLRHSQREVMRVKSADGWDTYRYCDIHDGALKVAGWLRAHGFKKTHTAALIAGNCPQWSMVYFGIVLAGGICVPLDPQASTEDLQRFIDDAGARIIFIDNALSGMLGGRFAFGKKIIALNSRATAPRADATFDAIVKAQDPIDAATLPRPAPDDTVALLYSSGTTAQPKGVQLTHKNLCVNVESVMQMNLCSADDCFISILPLFHAYAFMGTLLLPLCTGARIVYPATLKSAELVGIVKETGVTIMVGVPELFNAMSRSLKNKIAELPLVAQTLLTALTAAGWSLRRCTCINFLKVLYAAAHKRFGGQFRFFVSGGARLEPEVATSLNRFGFTILEGYGLTETSPIVTLNPLTRQKIGSVGMPVPGVNVKIAAPDANGIGEIAIRGDNVMRGYYRKEQETAAVIRDGWFYSGDLGYLDRDGYLYISGRNKEVIVLSSGKNIFPDEIEQEYLASRYIKEIGVFVPPDAGVQQLKAVVVPDFEAFKKSGHVNIYERVKWDIENISKRLSHHKRLMGFVISKGELPKTRLGKIKRYQLIDAYNQYSSDHALREQRGVEERDSMILKTPYGQKVAGFLKKELKLTREVRAHDHLELDLGVDSLVRVELVSGIEKMFHIRVTDEQLQDVATVSDVINVICNLTDMSIGGDAATGTAAVSWRELLRIDGQEKECAGIDLHPGMANRCLSYAAKVFVFVCAKVFCRLTVYGKEQIPKRGPYIICCNHSSFLDAFAVMAGVPHAVSLQMYFIGLRDIFYQPIIRWAMTIARLIAIDPSIELIRAMQAAAFVLQHGKILCIFPEGQRSIDGEVKQFKKGIGILAKELGVDIVPAAICGAHRAWPRTARFPKPHQVKIIFGKPIKMSEIIVQMPVSAPDDMYAMVAERIQKEVTALHDRIRF